MTHDISQLLSHALVTISLYQVATIELADERTTRISM